MVAASDTFQRVAHFVVPMHPAVTQHRNRGRIRPLAGDDKEGRHTNLALLVLRSNHIHQIFANGVTHCLFVAADGYVAYTVGLITVKVRHQPYPVHLLHIQLVLLDVGRLVKRAVLPFLPHTDGGHSVGIVRFLHIDDAAIGHCASIARHKVVKPFVVHRLKFRQPIEQCIQYSIKILGHIPL